MDSESKKERVQGTELLENSFSTADGFAYDIAITDSCGRKFGLFFAGNLDLYFISMQNSTERRKSKVERFIIENDSSLLYCKFKELLDIIDEDKYIKENNFILREIMPQDIIDKDERTKIKENHEHNKLIFYSDDAPLGSASRLEITKDKESVVIDLIKECDEFGKYVNGVRFNNSRSKNRSVVMAFMDIYRELIEEQKQKIELLKQKETDEKEDQPWLDIEI